VPSHTTKVRDAPLVWFFRARRLSQLSRLGSVDSKLSVSCSNTMGLGSTIDQTTFLGLDSNVQGFTLGLFGIR